MVVNILATAPPRYLPRRRVDARCPYLTIKPTADPISLSALPRLEPSLPIVHIVYPSLCTSSGCAPAIFHVPFENSQTRSSRVAPLGDLIFSNLRVAASTIK